MQTFSDFIVMTFNTIIIALVNCLFKQVVLLTSRSLF